MGAPLKRLRVDIRFGEGKIDQDLWQYLSGFGHTKGTELKRLAHKQVMQENQGLYDNLILATMPDLTVEQPVRLPVKTETIPVVLHDPGVKLVPPMAVPSAKAFVPLPSLD